MKALKIWAFVMAVISVLIVITSCILVNDNDETGTTTETVTNVETEEETWVLKITQEERILMAKVLWNETHNYSRKLKEYCASTMLNQLFSPYYGNTITEVLSRPGAYKGYEYLEKAKDANLTEELNVVDYICQNGSILPNYVWLFRADEIFEYEGIQIYEIVDNVYFQYFDEEHRATGWH